MAAKPTKNKYGVKCPRCSSHHVWKYGFTPTRKGHQDRFKCVNCGSTFYKGQPGTIARSSGSRKKKAG